jgi:putative membrane protein
MFLLAESLSNVELAMSFLEKTVSPTVSGNSYIDCWHVDSYGDKMQRQHDSHDDRGRFPTTLVAIVAVTLVVIVAVVLILSYFSSNYGYYGYGWGGGMMGFPMLFMFPIGVIILIVIAYVIYRGVWWGGGCGGHYGHYSHYGYRSNEERENAMEILRRRYANGEITKEQFEQMKKDIVG